MAHILLVGISLKQRLEVDLDFPRSRCVLGPPTFSLHLPMATNYHFPNIYRAPTVCQQPCLALGVVLGWGLSYLARKVPHRIPEVMLT